jgi:hypothetical protein
LDGLLGDEDEAAPILVSKVLRTYAADSKDGKDGSKKTSKLSWVRKIVKEKELIDSTKAELETESAAIRDKQVKLNKVKEVWKQYAKRRPESEAARSALRERGVLINKKAAALNARVESTKRVRQWLEERQRKLSNLEKTMLSPTTADYSTPGGTDQDRVSGGYLDKLCQELDDDLSALEVSSEPSSTPSSVVSEARQPSRHHRPSSHRKYKSSPYAGPAPAMYAADPNRGYYAHPPPQPQPQPPAAYYYDASHGFYQIRPPLPPPGMLFNDEVSDALPVFSRAMHGPVKHGHWTAPLHSGRAEGSASSIQYPADQRKSVQDTKRQLQEITNKMASTKEMYDNHAK